MGTYTTNYNLFMPTVGEQGWGDLVNGNFTIIDTAMKELDTRIGVLEPLSVIHVDETQNVTFPAKVYANGGIETDVLNVDEIVAADIKGLNITTDSNLISAISLSTTTDLANTGSSGSISAITKTKTVTYTENMLSNTVTVTCCANGGTKFGDTYYGRAYLTVNGTSVLDTGNTTGENYTVTTTITLSEGDELYAYAFTNVGKASYVKLACNGYLCY